MVKGAVSLGITRVLVLLVSVISLPLLIRVLGEDSYGLYVLIFGVVSLISGFSNLGLGFAAMRGLPSCENKTQREEMFYPQFWAHIGIATCIFCLVHIVGYYSSLGLNLHENDINIWVISLYLLTYPVYMQLDLLFKFSQRIKSLNALHLLLPFLRLPSKPMKYLHCLVEIMFSNTDTDTGTDTGMYVCMIQHHHCRHFGLQFCQCF